jgi:hypothetical protein
VTPRKEVRISAGEIGKVLHSDNLTIRVVDVEGHIHHRGTKAFFMPFLRKWRVVETPDPRKSSEDFPELGPRRLELIAESAASNDFIESSEIHTSFENVFPDHRDKPVAVFAVRELVVDKPMKVKIHTGSGSNFRLWLNGKAITKIIRTGWPVPDMESTSAELREGVNVLVAECLRGEKSWSLFVRFTDDNDNPLELRDDGRLAPKASSFRQQLLGASGSK